MADFHCIIHFLDVPIDNSRSTAIDFDIQNTCLIHGFAGFFRTVLYKDLFLSKLCKPRWEARSLNVNWKNVLLR